MPGVGLVVGGGALALAIGGALGTTAAGAVAGGMAGYLKDQGVSETDANEVLRHVRRRGPPFSAFRCRAATWTRRRPRTSLGSTRTSNTGKTKPRRGQRLHPLRFYSEGADVFVRALLLFLGTSRTLGAVSGARGNLYETNLLDLLAAAVDRGGFRRPAPKFARVRMIFFMRNEKGEFFNPPQKYVLTDPAQIEALVACLSGLGG